MSLADRLHEERLGCRLDFRGDVDCDGPARHVAMAEKLLRGLVPSRDERQKGPLPAVARDAEPGPRERVGTHFAGDECPGGHL